ncbi:MAG: ribosome maturation factor RimP [Gemmatimonadota bacterium]
MGHPDAPSPGRRHEPPAGEITALVGAAVEEWGGELVEVQVVGSARKPLVRAYVDVPGGTTAEACAEISRRIEQRLETSGLVAARYTLEVSSPGLDRPLRTRRDFERLRGRRIALRLREEGGGGRQIVGVLEEVGGGEASGGFWIRLRPERRAGGELRLGAEQIASAKPHVQW